MCPPASDAGSISSALLKVRDSFTLGAHHFGCSRFIVGSRLQARRCCRSPGRCSSGGSGSPRVTRSSSLSAASGILLHARGAGGVCGAGDRSRRARSLQLMLHSFTLGARRFGCSRFTVSSRLQARRCCRSPGRCPTSQLRASHQSGRGRRRPRLYRGGIMGRAL